MGRNDLADYATSHDRCAVCHARHWLEIHHISGRRGKNPDDHRNLIRLCRDCHTGYHSGGKRKDVDIGAILRAKQDEDGDVDEDYLAGLRRRKSFPNSDRQIPKWAKEERTRHRGQ